MTTLPRYGAASARNGSESDNGRPWVLSIQPAS
ncbi:hypothetical protein CBA19C6_12850 [Cupriavidus pauculus]|nr:hypothetical protein CBA19C6_12850 [Cupriavidus pauculus]